MAIGALCAVLPPSVHTVKSAASNFLLDCLLQHEHEHRQWSAAIFLGLISSCLHVTDHKEIYHNITGLLEVLFVSKVPLLKVHVVLDWSFGAKILLPELKLLMTLLNGPTVLKAYLCIAAYLPFIVSQAGDGNHFGGYWLDLAQAENNKQWHNLEELYLAPRTNLDLLLVAVQTASSLAISSRLLQVPFPKQTLLAADDGVEGVVPVPGSADTSARNNQVMVEEDIITSSVQYCCDGCSTVPILRRRWPCTICPDFDLCEACFEVLDTNRLPPPHSRDHPMTAIPIEVDSVGDGNEY
ncbi:hypothetical protein KIW84_033509 [Lathyrus oleraceus]|uniref:Auxin transport protein BIG n=1 Tax=Pisum sativum TaxID=3888 RepID=A0A9D4XW46_PEA|nr:hypothetical protein KIW84_033509 [Pisum sativum]